MNPAVRREDLFPVNRKRTVREVRYPAPGFLKDHNPRGGIPGMKVHFPESVDTAKRDVAEVESCGTAATHGLTFDEKRFELRQHSLDLFAEAVRESRHDQ